MLVHAYVKKCSRFYCSSNVKNQQSVYTNSDTQLMRECYRDGKLTGKIIWHKSSYKAEVWHKPEYKFRRRMIKGV